MSSQAHKCPICEHLFSLDANAQWVVCPRCGHRQSSAHFPDNAGFPAELDLEGDSETLIGTGNQSANAEFEEQTAVVKAAAQDPNGSPPAAMAPDADLPPAPSIDLPASTGIDLPETPSGEAIDMDFFETGTGASTRVGPREPQQQDSQTLTQPLTPARPGPPPRPSSVPDAPSAPPQEARATPIADGASVLPNLVSPSFMGPMVPDLSVPVGRSGRPPSLAPSLPPPLPDDAIPPTGERPRALAKIALKPAAAGKRVTQPQKDLPRLEDYQAQAAYNLPPPPPRPARDQGGISVYIPDAPVIEHRNGDTPFFQGQREKRAKPESQIPLLKPIKVRKPSTAISAFKPGING
jgi:hypothetical protein